MAKPTVQDIFWKFYPACLEKYMPSPDQEKAASCIINCKTGAYGANLSICEECGCFRLHYNSCKNRCCPMCQTLPKEKFLYNALYQAVSETISQLCAQEKHPGAKVGYSCILHTWGSEMNYHPHIHAVLLGGGLTEKREWKDTGGKFFLPIMVISSVFKGKYMDILKGLWEQEKLVFYGSAEKYHNHYAFKELLDICYYKEWIPYCKKTFNGARSVIKYLGKYTHRIAISNYRIIRMDENTVTFSVKDYRNEGRWKELTLSGVEFIRRFLMHVPPKRFVRIRHYGLLCNRTKSKSPAVCRNLLGCKKYISELKNMDVSQMLEHLYGINICICKHCGGRMSRPKLCFPMRC